MLKVNLLKGTQERNLKILSWQEELKNAYKTSESLEKYFKIPLPATDFPIFITQDMARKIKISGVNSPLWKQYIPNQSELTNDSGYTDPIGDIEKFASKQLIHRYKNRALFLPNINCPIHCRFCFRQHNLDPGNDLFSGKIKETLLYLEDHREIEELIFSGGDPLLMSDDKLFDYFQLFKDRTQIKYVRLHSKVVTTLPSRFTQECLDMLKIANKMFKKVILVIHCNHISELDEEAKNVIAKLKRTKIDLLLQSVLLKDVNDDVKSLKTLFQTFSDLGVRPYYLHHPDRVKNAMHFYLSIEEGRYLYKQLRDELPGWAIPHYVVDLPLGKGKTLNCNSESSEFSGTFIDRNGQACKY